MGNPVEEPKSPVPEACPSSTEPPTGGPIEPPIPTYTEMRSPVVQPPPPPDQLQPVAYSPWSVDLFDCNSDLQRFCISFWCPCVTFGQISEIIDRGSSSCGTNGAIYCCISGFPCIYSGFYRSRMRDLFLLEGDPCKDILIHWCFEPCALTQIYLELQNRGFDVSLGWQGNVEKQTRGVEMLNQMVPPIVEEGMRR